MMNKIINIVINAFPVAVMIGLMPFVKNDWLLALIYLIIIAISLVIHHEKNEFIVLVFGLLVMTLVEVIFTKTAVEFFIRNSLFGLIPVWLPILWAYSFVAIKRSVIILNQD